MQFVKATRWVVSHILSGFSEGRLAFTFLGFNVAERLALGRQRLPRLRFTGQGHGGRAPPRDPGLIQLMLFEAGRSDPDGAFRVAESLQLVDPGRRIVNLAYMNLHLLEPSEEGAKVRLREDLGGELDRVSQAFTSDPKLVQTLGL